MLISDFIRILWHNDDESHNLCGFYRLYDRSSSTLHLVIINSFFSSFDTVYKSVCGRVRKRIKNEISAEGYRLHLQPTGVGIPMQRRQRGRKRVEVGGGAKSRSAR